MCCINVTFHALRLLSSCEVFIHCCPNSFDSTMDEDLVTNQPDADSARCPMEATMSTITIIKCSHCPKDFDSVAQFDEHLDRFFFDREAVLRQPARRTRRRRQDVSQLVSGETLTSTEIRDKVRAFGEGRGKKKRLDFDKETECCVCKRDVHPDIDGFDFDDDIIEWTECCAVDQYGIKCDHWIHSFVCAPLNDNGEIFCPCCA